MNAGVVAVFSVMSNRNTVNRPQWRKEKAVKKTRSSRMKQIEARMLMDEVLRRRVDCGSQQRGVGALVDSANARGLFCVTSLSSDPRGLEK